MCLDKLPADYKNWFARYRFGRTVCFVLMAYTHSLRHWGMFGYSHGNRRWVHIWLGPVHSLRIEPPAR